MCLLGKAIIKNLVKVTMRLPCPIETTERRDKITFCCPKQPIELNLEYIQLRKRFINSWKTDLNLPFYPTRLCVQKASVRDHVAKSLLVVDQVILHLHHLDKLSTFVCPPSIHLGQYRLHVPSPKGVK